MVAGGFASIVFAYIRLSKPGISLSARNLTLKRHALSIFVYILTNLNIMITVAYTCFDWSLPNPDPAESEWWTILLKCLYYLEGVLSPLVRLNEPVFRVLIAKTMKSDFNSLIGFFYARYL